MAQIRLFIKLSGLFSTSVFLGNIYLIPCECALKSLQLCSTLRNPVDCSPSGSSVHGILQARIPKWVAVSYSMGSS